MSLLHHCSETILLRIQIDFTFFFIARPACQTHNHTQTDFFTQETAASIHSQGGEEKVWMTGASRGTTDWDFKSLTGTELISNLIQLQ